MSTLNGEGLVLALSGGIGGAKLALGLSHVLGGRQLIVVANTGDDFDHLGLRISPDIDTLLYTLGGVSNVELGWGRADETWNFMAELERLGGETWFKLGDKDLALHIERTRRLHAGQSLTRITRDVAARLGVAATILPMSDDPVRTHIRTSQGWIEFQDYFVRQRCEPRVLELSFKGAATARPQPEFLDLLQSQQLRAVVICPSNPLISIDPILAVPGTRDALAKCSAPVVAVSPIVGGKAIKGPTAKMMTELNIPVSARSVAQHYEGLIDVFVADPADASDFVSPPNIELALAPAIMTSVDGRIMLAKAVLAAADRASGDKGIRT